MSSLYVLNDQTLFAATSNLSNFERLVASTDGGKSWQIITDTMPVVSNIWFIDERIGVGVRSDGIIRTEDGGKTWTRATVPNSFIPALRAVQFVDSRVGFSSGGVDHDDRDIGGGNTNYGTFWRTEDGGLSWQAISQPFLNISMFYFLTAQEGYVATIDHRLFHTTDGGLHWQVISNEFPVIIGGLYFLSSQEAFVGGETFTSSGIYHTQDGGRSWQLEYQVHGTPEKTSINSLWLSKEAGLGYAAGRGNTIVKIEFK